METNDRLARAIRGLTIAIWCWIGFQILTYGLSYWSFWRSADGRVRAEAGGSSSWRDTTTPAAPDVESIYDNDFIARPMRDKVRLSTAILVVEMKEVGGLHKAIVQEVLKLKADVRLYYKVGDEYDDLNHFPGESCGDCKPNQRSLVFMQGNPATMRFATTFEGDRIASLGGMTIDELRELAGDSSLKDP